MKGIVLEELKDKLVVLTKEGDFVEIDRLTKEVGIGEEIIIKDYKANYKQILRGFTFVAATFVVVILVSYSIYINFATQGYVSVGINPSIDTNAHIEIAYNYFGKTIKLQALNKNGSIIMEKVNEFKFKSTDLVINKFIKAAESENIISKENENKIIIAVAAFNKKVDDESIDSSVEHYLKENGINAKVMIVLGNKNDYEKAKQSDISIDKSILIDRAIKNNSSYKFEDLNKKSIEEIIHIINEEEKNYEGY